MQPHKLEALVLKQEQQITELLKNQIEIQQTILRTIQECTKLAEVVAQQNNVIALLSAKTGVQN